MSGSSHGVPPLRHSPSPLGPPSATSKSRGKKRGAGRPPISMGLASSFAFVAVERPSARCRSAGHVRFAGESNKTTPLSRPESWPSRRLGRSNTERAAPFSKCRPAQRLPMADGCRYAIVGQGGDGGGALTPGEQRACRRGRVHASGSKCAPSAAGMISGPTIPARAIRCASHASDAFSGARSTL